jgi:hypothetical protein
MMKEYFEIAKSMGDRGKYQIRVETNDMTLVNDLGEALINQLAGCGKPYRIEYRFETKASSFIRWLLS